MRDKKHIDMIKALNESEDLTEWEQDFIQSMEKWDGILSGKQGKILERIHKERIGVDELFDNPQERGMG